jgi:hypothetical protein
MGNEAGGEKAQRRKDGKDIESVKRDYVRRGGRIGRERKEKGRRKARREEKRPSFKSTSG